jgi:hypothetical protein
MKNDSLAMVATISIVLGIASMIGYIDPAVCGELPSNGFITCQQAAAQHLWGFWGFSGFGLVTLIAGTLLSKRKSQKEK